MLSNVRLLIYTFVQLVSQTRMQGILFHFFVKQVISNLVLKSLLGTVAFLEAEKSKALRCI